jgi:toxin ParE1/3/4
MRYKLTQRAKGDLKRVYRSIARDNPSAARNQVATIRSKFKVLTQYPHVGEAVDQLRPNMRRFSVGSYVIYFVPRDGILEITRVLHGAQDAEAQF